MHERLANLLGATATNVTDLVLAEIRQVADTGDSASAALLTLAEFPGLAVTQLGQYIGLSQPAAARMVDGLVKRGLVERRSGAGRAVAVLLTDAGREAVDQLLRRREQILTELVEDLDPEEQVVLEKLLERVLQSVHGRTKLADRAPEPYLGELLCRMCDRSACIRGGARCPVTLAQHHIAVEGDSHG